MELGSSLSLSYHLKRLLFVSLLLSVLGVREEQKSCPSSMFTHEDTVVAWQKNANGEVSLWHC